MSSHILDLPFSPSTYLGAEMPQDLPVGPNIDPRISEAAIVRQDQLDFLATIIGRGTDLRRHPYYNLKRGYTKPVASINSGTERVYHQGLEGVNSVQLLTEHGVFDDGKVEFYRSKHNDIFRWNGSKVHDGTPLDVQLLLGPRYDFDNNAIPHLAGSVVSLVIKKA